MDRFENNSDTVASPARSVRALAMGPLSELPKALFIGQGGDVKLRGRDDDTPVVLRNVPDGSILPVRAAELYSEGTTALDIVGLF